MKKLYKKYRILAFGLLIIPCALLAQTATAAPAGETHVVASEWTQYVPIRDVNGIATAGNWEINIHKGKEEVIKFVGPKASVSQSGDILFLTGAAANGAKYRADVILPDINMINVNGNSVVYLQDFLLNNLTVKTSGVATVIGLKNSITNLKLMNAGSSRMDFSASKIQNAALYIVGPNETRLNMVNSGQLSGKIEGKTIVTYTGNVAIQSVLVRDGANITQKADAANN